MYSEGRDATLVPPVSNRNNVFKFELTLVSFDIFSQSDSDCFLSLASGHMLMLL